MSLGVRGPVESRRARMAWSKSNKIGVCTGVGEKREKTYMINTFVQFIKNPSYLFRASSCTITPLLSTS